MAPPHGGCKRRARRSSDRARRPTSVRGPRSTRPGSGRSARRTASRKRRRSQRKPRLLRPSLAASSRSGRASAIRLAIHIATASAASNSRSLQSGLTRIPTSTAMSRATGCTLAPRGDHVGEVILRPPTDWAVTAPATRKPTTSSGDPELTGNSPPVEDRPSEEHQLPAALDREARRPAARRKTRPTAR